MLEEKLAQLQRQAVATTVAAASTATGAETFALSHSNDDALAASAGCAPLAVVSDRSSAAPVAVKSDVASKDGIMIEEGPTPLAVRIEELKAAIHAATAEKKKVHSGASIGIKVRTRTRTV